MKTGGRQFTVRLEVIRVLNQGGVCYQGLEQLQDLWPKVDAIVQVK